MACHIENDGCKSITIQLIFHKKAHILHSIFSIFSDLKIKTIYDLCSSIGLLVFCETLLCCMKIPGTSNFTL